MVDNKGGYYTTLGVSQNATYEEIREAYRRLAKKYHPDVNSNSPLAHHNMIRINTAYEVLSDKYKRLRYDKINSYYDLSVEKEVRPDRRKGTSSHNKESKKGSFSNSSAAIVLLLLITIPVITTIMITITVLPLSSSSSSPSSSSNALSSNNSFNNNNNNNIISITTSINNWAEHKDYDFKIRYPSNWITVKSIYFAPNYPNVGFKPLEANIPVFRIYEKPSSYADNLTFITNKETGSFGGYLSESITTTLDGNLAHKVILKGLSASTSLGYTKVDEMEIFTVKGGKVYYLMYYIDDSNYFALLPIIQKMIDSFRFLSNNTAQTEHNNDNVIHK